MEGSEVLELKPLFPNLRGNKAWHDDPRSRGQKQANTQKVVRRPPQKPANYNFYPNFPLKGQKGEKREWDKRELSFSGLRMPNGLTAGEQESLLEHRGEP